jgi:hypothetical protein
MEAFERPYKQVSRIKALTLFFFRPKRFVELAVEHDIAWILSTEADIRASYLRGDYKPNIEKQRANAKHRSSSLRRSLFHSAFIVLGAAVVGLVAGILAQHLLGSLGSFQGRLRSELLDSHIQQLLGYRRTRMVQSLWLKRRGHALV